ncbi:hypothetical protein [Fodinicola feengrottensis]|uniref:hypothetical protein n=1 Tax=Fodinicola feengrottensis TaxID=435914 RepID=UPI0013CF9939|nr:hypothetical protein [Fodinicola feengrottensis]
MLASGQFCRERDALGVRAGAGGGIVAGADSFWDGDVRVDRRVVWSPSLAESADSMTMLG